MFRSTKLGLSLRVMDTYPLVAMLKSVRIVLAIAAYFDYEIWQMDVKTAFLHGNLTEDVYMIQPEGFVHPTSTSKVCKLKRSIYGLKQAYRSWNIRFDEVVTGLGFIKSDEDACLYKQLSGSSIVFLNLPAGSDAEVGEDRTSYSCIFRLRDMADGCQDGFPSWKFNRGRVYDTTRGFCPSD